MKKASFFILVLFICILQVKAQTDDMLARPTVDKRVELLSVVFRLVGNPEYNKNSFKLYTDRIESHFAPYKDHELIQLGRSLVKSNGVAYDAVMSMAVNLDERLNLPKNYGTLDQRWDRKEVARFVKLLKKFAKESRFDTFYHENEALYKEAVNHFMPIYESVDVKWYNDFYGHKSKERFRIILSMSNGPGNYGSNTINKQGVRNVFSIMGAWKTNLDGMVIYPPEAVLPTLIHEFNHSFVRFDQEMFRASGQQIYTVVGQQMASQAYGDWPIVLTEAMVRAAVIKYMKDHNFPANEIAKEVAMQKLRGFVWIGKLVDELDKYASARESYPTLESYMSRLAEVYVDFAQYTVNYDEMRPKIVSIDEFVNGHKTINSNTKSITINFDRPLMGRGYSFNNSRLGKDAFPKIRGVNYTNENRTVVVEVELQPAKEYGMTLLGFSFCTPEGDGMKPYELTFKTME